MLQSLLTITIILLFLSLLKIKSQSAEIKALTLELKDEQKEFTALSEYNDQAKQLRLKKQAKVLELFVNQSKVSNRDVVKALQVSSVTAFRYLDEMEKDGKIVQNGKFGHTVFYAKIK